MEIDIPKILIDNSHQAVLQEVLSSPSLKASDKGLYTYIINKPRSWDFSASRIAKDFSDGVTAIYSSLSRLEEAGYLTRSKQPDGRIKYSTMEEPLTLDANDQNTIIIRALVDLIKKERLNNA